MMITLEKLKELKAWLDEQSTTKVDSDLYEDREYTYVRAWYDCIRDVLRKIKEFEEGEE